MQRYEAQRVQEQRKAMRDRQMRYAELVKEIHQPRIDVQKRIALQLEIDKKTRPVRQALYASQSVRALPSMGGTVDAKRKWGPNSMLPPPKPVRESKAIDYLKERRYIRETWEK
jgi:hypothetical protein